MAYGWAGCGMVLLAASGCVVAQADDPPPASGGGSAASGGDGSGGGSGGFGGEPATGGSGGGEPLIVINEGFIGGPCDGDRDCPYDGGFCLQDAQGFPGGMCSLDCSGLCPDEDGFVTTFCSPPETLGTNAAEGLCTTRCDYGQSPTGCRTGYQCQLMQRYGDPEVEVYGCVPGEDAPFELGACHEELLALGIAFSPAPNPLEHPEGHPELTCDVVDPVWVEPTLADVVFHPGAFGADPDAIFSACPHALALFEAAEVMRDLGVSDAMHYGVYNCRTIAGTSTLSEHGLANAIDVAGLALGSGEQYTVLDDWELDEPSPQTPAGQLLQGFVETLYEEYLYNVILTPDYDEAHADHFHCDLTEGSHYLK